jgi:high-affinity Fe2+/Pb2+ permease
MHLPKFRYVISAGAMLGFIIPLLVTAVFELRIFRIPKRVLLAIWPSSIMLMATETLGYSRQAFAILGWSTA